MRNVIALSVLFLLLVCLYGGDLASLGEYRWVMTHIYTA